nr:translation initiation factor IF-2 N-terminal domain-containing protein [Corynebacterium efficiens]
MSPSAVLAADFDRSQLGEKTRVHQLAKQLGLTSKDLVVALDSIGLVKVAQSTLSREEATRLLDLLAKPVEEAPAEVVPDVEPVEKIRRRVEKNVANEIQQIQEKVERELADVVEDTPEDAPEDTPEQAPADTDAADPSEDEEIRRRVEKNVANEIQQIENRVERELAEVVARSQDEQQSDEPVDLMAAAQAEAHAELLEDIIPEITPPPTEAPVYAPIFVAPAIIPTEDLNDTDDPDAQERVARKRRGRRGTGRGKGTGSASGSDVEAVQQKAEDEASTSTVDTPEPEAVDEPVGIKGSTRLEAQRRRRTEMREEGRNKKRHVVSTREFIERRESMERRMIVRERQRTDGTGLVTQVGVLEDDLLVEQFVTSDSQSSMVGNIYLGRVQNVLPSMEAAFIDIGKGRNGVLYAGEVDWKAAGLGGRGRRIEQALKSGQKVLVQVTKDPVGHKGARLTTQISLAGRYLVYVPGGRSAGISRKLPGPERKRLKEILGRVVPPQGGTIIRTAAEGVSEENIAADVNRLHTLWEQIQERTKQEKKSRNTRPVTMYEEPDMLVKVIRDLFNEDFTSLIVDGDRAWNTVRAYIQSVAPDLVSRVEHFDRADYDGKDAFEAFGLNTQLEEAMSRKVNLPSGGSLIIDKTEAMTVIDINTGRYVGKGVGNLEETVTLNNIEAAEEIVRQLRLRDIGGMIVIDFIDMVLPENRDLVLRRLNEALENDRTRHQVSEVTSLGLVQMTRKRIGAGLLETFSSECEHCAGRGLVIHPDPVDNVDERVEAKAEERARRHKNQQEDSRPQQPVRDPARHPMVVAMQDLVEDEDHDLDKEFEDLAASVIITDDAEDTADTAGTVDTADDTEPEITADEVISTVEPEEGPRRRARRRRGRQQETPETPVEPEATGDTTADDIAAIAAAAVDIADAEDPDEPSGANYVSDAAGAATSYEQALAEFEASPRRRRATRGNSRSDHAPKPEDFKSEPARREVEPIPVEEIGEAEEKPRRRSRGRGRSQRPAPVVETTVETAVEDIPEETPRRNRPSEVAASAPSRPGRGRRRAVRRSSGHIETLDDATPTPITPSPADKAGDGEREASPSKGRRRRRRAIRVSGKALSQSTAEKQPEPAAPAGSGRRRRGTRKPQRG